MNRLHATKDFWLAALRADGPALQDAVAQAGPDAPVPSCPGWTVADLVEHVTVAAALGARDVPRGVATTSPAPTGSTPSARPGTEALDGLRRELTGTIETLERARGRLPGVELGAAEQDRRASGTGGWPTRSRCTAGTPKSAAGRPDPDRDQAGRRRRQRGARHLAARRAAARARPTCTASCTWWPPTPATSGSSGCAARAWRCSTPARSWTPTITTPAPQASGTASDLLLALMGRQRLDRLVVIGDPRLITPATG